MSLKAFISSLTTVPVPLTSPLGGLSSHTVPASPSTPVPGAGCVADQALDAAIRSLSPYKALDSSRQARDITDAFFDTSFTLFDHSQYVSLEADRMNTLYGFWATPTALDPTPDTTPSYLRNPNAPPRRRPLDARWLTSLAPAQQLQQTTVPETAAYVARRNAERAAQGLTPLFPLPSPPPPASASADTAATSSAQTATDSSSSSVVPPGVSPALNGACAHVAMAAHNASRMDAHLASPTVLSLTQQSLAMAITAAQGVAERVKATTALGEGKRAARKLKRRKNVEYVRGAKAEINAALEGAFKRLNEFHKENLAALQKKLAEPVVLPDVALTVAPGLALQQQQQQQQSDRKPE